MEKLFFIIAGEASGDLLGSKLIQEIKQFEPQARFIGIGGELMKKAGLETIFNINELSVMGFFEVLPHIPRLLSRIRFTSQKIAESRPDFLITIDAPDFCFRVLSRLKSRFKTAFLKTKKIHLIAPSVWAYRAGRAKKIAELYDLLLAILPFEPPYFEKYGLKTRFIGHPLLDEIPDFSKRNEIRTDFLLSKNLKKDSILLLITPGSRNSEVERIFPEFISAINSLGSQFNKIKPLILVTEKTKQKVVQMAKNFEITPIFLGNEDKQKALFVADFGLAKSGTNAIEMSLNRLPIVVAYKVNFLSYWLIKMLIKIRFANLINLVANQEIIPELIQNQCRGDNIANEIKNLIEQPKLAKKQIENCHEALKIMGLSIIQKPLQIAAKEILQIKRL